MNDVRAVDEAQSHIRDINADGELPLTARRQLKESLVALLSSDERGLTFITVLGLACAKRAWPVWQTVFPSESRPIELAQAAVSRNTQEGTPGSSWIRNEFVKVKNDLDGKFLLGRQYFPAIYAGFASWTVARDGLSWDHAKVTQGDTELNISPEKWDPCFFASLAVTGGATWEQVGRSDIRREFWHWYLTAAVPEAFAAAIKR